MRTWRRVLVAAVLTTLVGGVLTAHADSHRPPPAPPTVQPTESMIPASASVASSWPVVYRVATSDPVVFVTIDDGYTRSDAAYADVRSRKWPITSFVLPGPLSEDPAYFETIGSPSDFGDHTVSHTDLTHLSYDGQRNEICGARDAVASMVGSRPGWFRAPYGSWNQNTIAAANACGYPGTVLWDDTVDGSTIRTTYSTIRPGDIVLLHYTANLQLGVDTLAAELARLGLHPAPLANYLPPAFTQPAPPPNRLVSAQWFLRTTATSGNADMSFTYGSPGDLPITGDWNGDGVDTAGVIRGNAFYLRNSDTSGVADKVFTYGDPGDEVIVGDWNGDGVDTVGVVRGNAFYLRNSNSSGVADKVFTYGDPGDEVIVGDWNGDGVDTAGVVRGSTFYLRNSNSSGVADKVFMYGDPGDEVIVGDWNGDATDTIAVIRGSTFYARNSNSTGVANTVFSYGNPGDLYVAGRWRSGVTADGPGLSR